MDPNMQFMQNLPGHDVNLSVIIYGYYIQFFQKYKFFNIFHNFAPHKAKDSDYMKKSISGIITYLLFTLTFFNGCSNDSDETKVTYTYSLLVDYTGKESTGDSDPALIAIDKKMENARIQINNTFADYSQWEVTGKGETKEDAEKDADSQALTVFNQYKDQIEDKLNLLENDFAQWRKEYSEQLMTSTENGYRKYTLTYMLKREEKTSSQPSYGKIVELGKQHKLEVYSQQSYE